MNRNSHSFCLYNATDSDGNGIMPAVRLVRYTPEPSNASGAAIIICPGGGYVVHAAHESDPVAQWLVSLGITAFVLYYRLAPQYTHPAMLEDAARAMRFVRAHATEWYIDPARIGILGFSAGGHLASLLATHYDAGNPAADDAVERVSCRPDLTILIYPVITLQPPYGHDWCRECLIGQTPPAELVANLSTHLHVTTDTPPSFLVHTADDQVPCENSLLMAQALSQAQVPFELHLYERGGHGYGLAPDDPIVGTWPTRCAAWLQQHGFCTAQEKR
ncbi:MAG: Acetyl esterase/lipase [Chloroflexi bacterium AL-W]|nr:Acetyl esterase/lipase [Chloroflexi bacterium AL-N1]NOK66647.1 Acetyl esterase/lipase [Chloroflexi bacterium AL-N10]NOK72035.1 Acetyl esterase/lipase [Chloroflexi bacterium AL-N5]NOK81292.1 Acetyl esterase/lipase [Chloroflexi bacterium AL-W]NOK89565.1 Acetyl esterase/lipase [Chloroflexi bacterium AL-N15]